MSECVVRMEMPQGCVDCPFINMLLCCCAKGRRYVGNSPVRPDWCPILCQLPEGHGRLVDADEDVSNYITVWDCKCSEFGKQTVMAVDDMKYLPTIVPAERSET